jgi:hypothetical protein
MNNIIAIDFFSIDLDYIKWVNYLAHDSLIKHINMSNEFDLKAEYENDRYEVDENKTMWKGVLILAICGVLDWELFQWLFSILKVKH